jgi:hypothetical protein
LQQRQWRQALDSAGGSRCCDRQWGQALPVAPEALSRRQQALSQAVRQALDFCKDPVAQVAASSSQHHHPQQQLHVLQGPSDAGCSQQQPTNHQTLNSSSVYVCVQCSIVICRRPLLLPWSSNLQPTGAVMKQGGAVLGRGPWGSCMHMCALAPPGRLGVCTLSTARCPGCVRGGVHVGPVAMACWDS